MYMCANIIKKKKTDRQIEIGLHNYYLYGTRQLGRECIWTLSNCTQIGNELFKFCTISNVCKWSKLGSGNLETHQTNSDNTEVLDNTKLISFQKLIVYLFLNWSLLQFAKKELNLRTMHASNFKSEQRRCNVINKI